MHGRQFDYVAYTCSIRKAIVAERLRQWGLAAKCYADAATAAALERTIDFCIGQSVACYANQLMESNLRGLKCS